MPSNKEFTKKGFLLITIPNIGWGIADVCIAYIGRGQVVTWVHSFTAALFLISLTFVLKQKINIKDFLNAFPYGVQRAILWGVLFYAFQEDNPTIAITVLSFAIVLTVVIFGPLMGEKVTLKIVSIALIGVVGLVLTSNQNLTEFSFSKGAVLALIMLPLSSAGTYILRHVQKKVPSNMTGLYMYTWIALIYTPVMFFVNPRFEFTSFDIFVIIVLMITGAGGHLLFGISQDHTTLRANAILSIIHIPVTAIASWIFLSRELKLHQMLGIVIVVSVVTYFSISSHSKEVEEALESQQPEL